MKRSLKKYGWIISAFFLGLVVFLSTFSAWADGAAVPGATMTVTATTTPGIKGKLAAAPTPTMNKDFQWYLKNGCNCAQCRAARQQQADDQERLKETFQP